MPSTVDGFLLLGWMERDEAVTWLREHCWFDPPLTEDQAVGTWDKYRRAVEALPERRPEQPRRLPIGSTCRPIVQDFLSRIRGPEVLDVINIDPRSLLVYQLYVVGDRANDHASHLGGNAWVRLCLQIERPVSQMPLRSESGIIKVQLPHAEHFFTLQPQGFVIQQGGGFISVCELEGRMLLKAGYHRSFAFSRSLMNEPDAREKSLLVALTKALPPQISADFPKQGLRTTVLGPRPPLFSDFFDVSLAMAVKLRKKRYEMHIKVDVVPIDDD
jgi:hypothetical protein